MFSETKSAIALSLQVAKMPARGRWLIVLVKRIKGIAKIRATNVRAIK